MLNVNQFSAMKTAMIQVQIDQQFEGWHLTSNELAFTKEHPSTQDWVQVGRQPLVVSARRTVDGIPYGDAIEVLRATFAYGESGEECDFLPGRQLLAFHIKDEQPAGSEAFWADLAQNDGQAASSSFTALFGAAEAKPAIERVREVIWRRFAYAINRPTII